MDDRLNHEQKMFSKTNWEFTKKIVEGNFESQVSPILTLDVSKKCNFRCNHCVAVSYTHLTLPTIRLV